MPTNPTPRQGSARRLYRSKVVETTFGTAATLTEVIPHDLSFEPLATDPEKISDQDMASGNNTVFPQRDLIVDNRLIGDVPIYGTARQWGLSLAHAIGADAVTTPSGSFKLHTIEPGDVDIYLPGETRQENRRTSTADTDADIKATGVCIDKTKLEWKEKGPAVLADSLISEGRDGTAASVTESGLSLETSFLTSKRIRVYMYAASTNGQSPWDGAHYVVGDYGASYLQAGAFPAAPTGFTNISHLVKSGFLEWRNGAAFEQNGGTGSGAALQGGPPMTKARGCTLSLRCIASSEIESWLKGWQVNDYASGYQCCFQIYALNALNECLSFVLPLAALASKPKEGTGRGPQTYVFEWKAIKVYTGTDRPVVSVGYVNTDSTDYVPSWS